MSVFINRLNLFSHSLTVSSLDLMIILRCSISYSTRIFNPHPKKINPQKKTNKDSCKWTYNFHIYEVPLPTY